MAKRNQKAGNKKQKADKKLDENKTSAQEDEDNGFGGLPSRNLKKNMGCGG